MARGIAIALLALGGLGVGCTPDIPSGTYYCGPERYCPPDQMCDEPSYTCVASPLAHSFSCPEGSERDEPDDDLASARDLGTASCSVVSLLTGASRCIDDAGDADYYTFDDPVTCSEDHRIAITVHYPVALMPLAVDLLDADGAVVATSELCTPEPNFTGEDSSCVVEPPEPQRYYVRVAAAPDAPDCGGDCAYNQYTLDINFLVP